MSETLGSLVDKLSICNNKLWHVQEIVNQAAKEGAGIDAETVQKLSALNLQRNRLATEIDEFLAQAIRTGVVPVDPNVKVV